MQIRSLVILGTFIAAFFVWKVGLQLYSSFDGKLHIIVCDVGQGEGIYIRTPRGANIIFDGGPDDSILTCLSRFMPLWESRIDLLILSHPHADHYMGIKSILKRYQVAKFITEDVQGDTHALASLRGLVDDEKIAWSIVSAGDSFRISDGVRVRVVGPTESFLESKKHAGVIDPSDASLQVLISYKDFDALLTGDSNVDQMEDLLAASLPVVEMLQTPHHGSKNGLSHHILESLHPKIASISVGKNNYGHPSRLVLNLYQKSHIPYRRTDREGDLRLSTDGKSYNLK